jgi:hypothetical protein
MVEPARGTTQDTRAILACIERYFDGLYEGDLGALEEAFHPRARLVGVVRGEHGERGLAEYLAAVAARRSPRSLGEPRAMRVELVEHHGETALVRARIAMLGFDYVDWLALVRREGRWSIVHKLYTHVGA